MIPATLGWIGICGTFVAYVMVSRGQMRADSLRYGMLNAVGGLLAGISAALYGAWPSAASSFLWDAVGAATVARAAWRRRGVIGGPVRPEGVEPVSLRTAA